MNHQLTEFSDFIANTSYEQLPFNITEKAKRHLLDTLGAALAGTDSDIWRQCKALAMDEGGNAQAVLWGDNKQVTPRQAAWLNGIASHMYELDDCGGCDHSGAVVIPALFAALPMATQPVSGREFITAMVVGYDVGRRVLEACGGYEPHNGAGWHSTATCGVFGAAAAVCSLLRIPPEDCASALGIAASLSGGIWAFIHDGSQTKKLHCGRAAEAGLQSAMLAAKGIKGPSAVFEDKWGGFLKTIAADSMNINALTEQLSVNWKLGRCSVKPYASCRGAHSAVDALSILLAEHPGITLKTIRVRLNPFLNDMCGGKNVDQLAAAQMSLPYALVARLLYQDAGLASYSEEKRCSPGVQEALQKVMLEIDNNQSNDDEPVIILETISGEVWEKTVPIPSGSPSNFLDDQHLFSKFRTLAGMILSPEHSDNVIDLCMNLESVKDMKELSHELKNA